MSALVCECGLPATRRCRTCDRVACESHCHAIETGGQCVWCLDAAADEAASQARLLVAQRERWLEFARATRDSWLARRSDIVREAARTGAPAELFVQQRYGDPRTALGRCVQLHSHSSDGGTGTSVWVAWEGLVVSGSLGARQSNGVVTVHAHRYGTDGSGRRAALKAVRATALSGEQLRALEDAIADRFGVNAAHAKLGEVSGLYLFARDPFGSML